MKLQRNFTALKQVATGEWIDRDAIHIGDEVIVESVSDGCDQPGCCPAYLVFTVPDWPELGMLEGEIGGVSATEIIEWENDGNMIGKLQEGINGNVSS